MDALSGQWMAQLEMMESLEYDHASLSSESLSSCTTEDHDVFGKLNDGFLGSATHNPHFTVNRPAKMAPKNQGSPPSSCTKPQSMLFRDLGVSSPQVVDSNKLRPILKQPKVEITDYESTINPANNFITNDNKKKRPRSMASTPTNLLSPDHIVAERRRRQKLNQRFIGLSALIPGLKKMDKASVLGEAVKYLKHLNQRVKTLEEQLKQRNAQSVVVVKKLHLSMEDDHDDADNDRNFSSSNSNRVENSKLQPQEAVLPEIEARIMNKEVFIMIHCEKQQGLLGRILNEMDKLHLTVTVANSMPFGNYDLVITITAQMEANFCATAKDIFSKLETVI